MKGGTSILSLVLDCFKYLVAIETLIWETIQKLKNETFHKCQALYLSYVLESLNSIVKGYSSTHSPVYSPREVSLCQTQESGWVYSGSWILIRAFDILICYKSIDESIGWRLTTSGFKDSLGCLRIVKGSYVWLLNYMILCEILSLLFKVYANILFIPRNLNWK